ncbi:Tyrosine recombinase XerC [Ascidiaceihabitans donghaensis]|uniref:Tyrosine recombinase XerC n=1 Tax=Ascidiaceihabitans donghaensis TaxID=1510460 RepID=A0A2R8BGY0_9RHOB|nr:DUF6538 domain-containing protein [Ascidiaceihabitans donghaensis]SPH22348.1 Tyrosine recombinase XerC [Ascidiaceihabitans donghaensis]
MSAQIKYAYLKGHTWLYRRNYPKEIAMVLGQQAMKQSLKTRDTNTARVRAAEINARYETLVAKVRDTAEAALSAPELGKNGTAWEATPNCALEHLRASLSLSGAKTIFPVELRVTKKLITAASREYLNARSNELRPSGFRSVRYSVDLFSSKYGKRSLCSLTRRDGREFLSLIAQISPHVGKSEAARGLGLEKLVALSAHGSVFTTVRTQKRIWSQVNHFLDSMVYNGHLEANPFKSVRFDQKIKPQPYAVITDEEVKKLLHAKDNKLHAIMLTCLLTGMRAGEAVGLTRKDLVPKGNLGIFAHVRPNELRLLKTDAAERFVPVHPKLEVLFDQLPATGPLFPDLKVNDVTKGFAKIRKELRIQRPGLVFHSTRKWFITQCERTGVPEHFTASLVGHKSARSENGITYGIYSAGISDEQKRGIIDQIRLPVLI